MEGDLKALMNLAIKSNQGEKICLARKTSTNQICIDILSFQSS